MDKLFGQFYALEFEYRKLETEREALRDRIVAEMKKAKMDKTETDFGTFTVARKVNWLYTPAVKKLEEKVKLAKIKEEQKGLAGKNETEYLRYTAVKV